MYLAHKDTGAPLCNYRPGFKKAERLKSEGHTLVETGPETKPSESPSDYRWTGDGWALTDEAKARLRSRLRQRSYPSSGDQLGALTKDAGYKQMAAGRIRKTLDSAKTVAELKAVLSKVLGLFDSVEELDEVMGRINKVKKDIP